MTPLSVIELGPTNRSQIESFVYFFTEELEAGRLDALKVWLKLKAWEETIGAVKDAIKNEAFREASTYGKGEHGVNGFVFSISGTGGKPDFSVCNDPIRDQLVEQLKERESFLKNLKTPVDIVNEETAEVVATIRPPLKRSGDTIKVSLR